MEIRSWENPLGSRLTTGRAEKNAVLPIRQVRAGMVADPADYRWSSYGEAMGGGGRGNGAKARAGLVRAMLAHKGYGPEPKFWASRVSREYRMLLLEEGEEKLEVVINQAGEQDVKVVRKGMKTMEVVIRRCLTGIFREASGCGI